MKQSVLVTEFKKHFPSLADNIKEITNLGLWMLEIHYHDGSRGVYDGVLHTFKYVPKHGYGDLTEHRWNMELGVKINRTMLMRGYRLYELAERSGISERTLSNIMNGRNTTSTYNLKKIAKALSVSVGYLTDFEKYYE